jgi:branched-chain amino acid transport system permease protein
VEKKRPRWLRADVIFFAIAVLIPLIDAVLPGAWQIGRDMRPIFLFAILGLGLNIVTGFAGLLNLGVAAFMAIGVYSYGILSAEIYPFRLGFWGAIAITPLIGAVAGLVLGAPTLRLRGDYLAIVTLGFGEIVQDLLRNVETITRGTQGINPLAYPTFLGYTFVPEVYEPWYYLFLAILLLVVIVNHNVEGSRLGRAFVSLREDELAAACMGINTVKIKLMAFALGAALASLMGGLFAAYLNSTGEPGNYDFTVSILAVCIVIVGGIGSISGVLVGALVMVGLDSLVLVKLAQWLENRGLSSSANVISTPNNWKFLIFGLALILMMRFRPEGLLPSRRMQAELHQEDDGPPGVTTASGGRA